MGEYLGIALAAPQVQAQMVPKGSGLQHIHLEDLRQDCVPLCDLPEQQQIVELVDRQTTNVDHIAAEMADYSWSATTLRQATLRAAFSGKLVPQCADDEPASSLLKSLGPPLSSNTRRTASRARRRIP
jgi:type I restriction enzyme S subunit